MRPATIARRFPEDFSPPPRPWLRLPKAALAARGSRSKSLRLVGHPGRRISSPPRSPPCSWSSCRSTPTHAADCSQLSTSPQASSGSAFFISAHMTLPYALTRGLQLCPVQGDMTQFNQTGLPGITCSTCTNSADNAARCRLRKSEMVRKSGRFSAVTAMKSRRSSQAFATVPILHVGRCHQRVQRQPPSYRRGCAASCPLDQFACHRTHGEIDAGPLPCSSRSGCR